MLIYDITVAFGKDSLFAEALDDRFWRVVDVPPAAWVAMPDLDRTALPSGGDLACRIGGLRREGRQSYVLALLQCVLRIPLLQLNLFLSFWGTSWRLLIFS